MNESQPNQIDYDKPVAYDVDGRPLYSHPTSGINNQQTQAVHLIRPTEPDQQIISDETRLKHEKSKRAYPECDLSAGEYVIAVIRRHPIGLVLPVLICIFLVTLALTILFNFDYLVQALKINDANINPILVFIPVAVFVFMVISGTYVTYQIYSSNKIYLTNESIIQEIQTGVFAKKERMVSLNDIEDVSYTQNGMVEQMFNFGSIRLSTEGESTIYTSNYVYKPKDVIAMLKNAVESFKNGRAII